MTENEFFSPFLYRIHDPKTLPGCVEVTGFDFQGGSDDPELGRLIEAHRFNSENWGIFWAVNEFEGPRKKENLKKLRAWFVECDGGDKDKMLKRFSASLMPSMLVESKNGFHAYWFCAPDATVENYRSIIEFNLIPFFDGDRNAKDICRILRVPDYLHCKDPENKFLIKKHFIHETLTYSESDMKNAFPIVEREHKAFEAQKEFRKIFKEGNDLWEKIYDMNCAEALQRLSGSSAVKGERFTFKRTQKGTLNVLVDGKSTSCWIDQHGRIGSTDRGGPTIWQWLKWYGATNKEVHEEIKRHFPELFD